MLVLLGSFDSLSVVSCHSLASIKLILVSLIVCVWRWCWIGKQGSNWLAILFPGGWRLEVELCSGKYDNGDVNAFTVLTQCAFRELEGGVYRFLMASLLFGFSYSEICRVFEDTTPTEWGPPVYRSWLYLHLSEMNAHF